MTGIAVKGKKGFQPKEVLERRKKARKEHGFSDEIKTEQDYIDVMNEELEQLKLINTRSINTVDDFGFTDDFYRFIGLNKEVKRDYRIPLRESTKEQLQKYGYDFGRPLEETGYGKDYAEYYTPIDDFYGTGGGGDYVSDYGRVPVSHLMILCSQRLGVAWRGCNSVANDVFRNRFVFVKYDEIETEIKNRTITRVLKWMRKTKFWDKMVDCLDFERRTGLGHLVAFWDHEKKLEDYGKKAPKKRPDYFESFSSYYMTPINIFSHARLDYDKDRWDFIGGFMRGATIHHSRVYCLETRRVEGGLRGIAIPELCWVPLMCYLNTSYYILKSLSQLGTAIIGVKVPQEFPQATMVEKYMDILQSMRANKMFLFGKNMEFQIQNVAGKIGEGIASYLEFLKEDISSAWIIPKNQLFGRSEGGGLQGAGALVSKEDYLSSNLSTLQLNLTNDIMNILIDIGGFTELEEYTIRWNLDLHKTEQQRLVEQLMREQLEQAKYQTIMTKLQYETMKIQNEQAKMQWEQLKKKPQLLLPQQPEKPEKMEKKVNEDEEIKPKPTRASNIPGASGDFLGHVNRLNEDLQKNIMNIDERIKKRMKDLNG